MGLSALLHKGPVSTQNLYPCLLFYLRSAVF
jgi:hypothetical protein